MRGGKRAKGRYSEQLVRPRGKNQLMVPEAQVLGALEAEKSGKGVGYPEKGDRDLVCGSHATIASEPAGWRQQRLDEYAAALSAEEYNPTELAAR